MYRLGLLIAVLALSAGFAATAEATPPRSASGTQTLLDITITPVRVAGPNEIYDIVSTATIDGTFTGTLTSHLTEVLHPSGDSNIRGEATCTCAIDGRSGVAVFRSEGTITGDPFSLEARLSLTAATEDLTGLEAQLTVVWDGVSLATYSGTYHFDP
jgi:hypothetical protein